MLDARRFQRHVECDFFGINNKGEIPGIYSTAGSKSFSFIIKPPYRHIQRTRTQGAVTTAISNNGTSAGYLSDPTRLRGTWGVVKHGVYGRSFAMGNKDRAPTITELWAVNDKNVAVGYYTNDVGVKVAAMLHIATEEFRPSPPRRCRRIRHGGERQGRRCRHDGRCPTRTGSF